MFQPEIRATFNAMDTNKDGRISVTELMKAQQALGCNPTMDETKEMIREVDTDSEGLTCIMDSYNNMMKAKIYF